MSQKIKLEAGEQVGKCPRCGFVREGEIDSNFPEIHPTHTACGNVLEKVVVLNEDVEVDPAEL